MNLATIQIYFAKNYNFIQIEIVDERRISAREKKKVNGAADRHPIKRNLKSLMKSGMDNGITAGRV